MLHMVSFLVSHLSFLCVSKLAVIQTGAFYSLKYELRQLQNKQTILVLDTMEVLLTGDTLEV